jgi:CRP-like cAMP-binding protein
MAIQKSARRYDKDAAIVQEGAAAGNEIYFMTKGSAVVEVRGSVVGQVKTGEWFGELAAILSLPRTATVRAVGPCDVLVFKGLDDGNLYEAMSKDAKMIQQLVRQLGQRLVETSLRHAEETAQLAQQAVRYRRAVSGTLYALERLSEKFKSKVMEETRQHLAALSGIPTGSAQDADPAAFPTSKASIFG